MPAEDPPVAILVRRGDRIESRHRVRYAIADARGRLRAHLGAAAEPVLPRSAVKPLQAIALVESGAADRFAVSEAELALASGSHAGEPAHVETVRRWLKRLGLDESALACGAHPPVDRHAAEQLVRGDRCPGPVHNNCSGKHAAMVTLALHLGAPIEGYAGPHHPVQRSIAEVLAEMADLDHPPPPAIDGCGVPTFPIPLDRLAAAMARFVAPAEPSSPRGAACARIRRAMIAQPRMVAGSGRAVTAILEAVPGVVVKSGAEGVYVAALADRGLGLALKVEDGASRAAEVAAIALLHALGALDAEGGARLARFARPPVTNHAGAVAGRIEPAPGWPALPAELGT